MFIKDALAQTATEAASGTSIENLAMQIGLIFVIFYFIIVRPQRKQAKQHETLLKALKKGDKIITAGGIYATVVKADETAELVVEIANGVNITVNKATVRDVIIDKPEPANSNKKSKKG